MGEVPVRYEARHIRRLETREAVRGRPGMYVGSTSRRGLHVWVFTVVEWAVNEVLEGRAGRVDVTFTPDGGVRVAHDGPGVPFDGGTGLEALLTRLSDKGGPSGRKVALVAGFCPGPAVVNYLSSHLTAEVRRPGVRWVQEYVRGTATGPPTAAGPTYGSGTVITCRPDAEIFETVRCSFDAVADRLREIALLNRDVDITLADERAESGEPRTLRLRFPDGVREFVALLDTRSGTPVHPDVIAFEHEDPRMAGTVEAALRWRDTPGENVLGFANSRPTPQGGSHVTGLRDAVAAAVTAHARARRLLPAASPDLSPGRIGDGLTAVISVKLDAPEFEGATRGVLGGDVVRRCVAEAVRDRLGVWLDAHPEQAAAVIGRILRGT